MKRGGKGVGGRGISEWLRNREGEESERLGVWT